MRRAISVLLALLALSFAAAQAETGLANPWTQTTAQGLMDVLGVQLGLPDGATNATWRMMESVQMGQVSFSWQGENYTARVAPADAFEDISGMVYEWESQEDCAVGRCKGVCRRAHSAGKNVDLCLWYDDLTGLMYSVGVVGHDLDGFDITAAANILYIPMQTE